MGSGACVDAIEPELLSNGNHESPLDDIFARLLIYFLTISDGFIFPFSLLGLLLGRLPERRDLGLRAVIAE